MILVIGPTGAVGGEVCRQLAQQGRQVRGLVRSSSSPDAVARLRGLGVELVEGDLRVPASLAAACRSVETVVSTATITHSRQPGETIESTDHQGQLNLVEAARGAGVRSFVYLSFSSQIGGDDALTTAKRAVERRLRESGMGYTILRPSYFMEVWLSPALGFDHPNRKATIYGVGEAPISWISFQNVADFAVRVVGEPSAQDVALELGGPEALSPHQVVRTFEAVAGAPFEVTHVPQDALRAKLAAATDSLQRTFASLMLSYARGDPIPMADTLRRFPQPLTSVRQYAERVARG